MRAVVLPQLYERFRQGTKPPASLGPSRDYNVDMVPKFIMNSGELVKPVCRQSEHTLLLCKGVSTPVQASLPGYL